MKMYKVVARLICLFACTATSPTHISPALKVLKLNITQNNSAVFMLITSSMSFICKLLFVYLFTYI